MKIGFIGNFYGTPKGHSYIANNLVSACKDAGHDTHMFRIGTNPIPDEFTKPTTMKDNPHQIIPEKDFKEWLNEIKPDWCIFNEYCQWWDEDHDKVAICKEQGIKTVGWLVWEKLNWDKLEHYKLYDKVISATEFQTKLMRKHGVYNTVYVPWGVDFKQFDKVKTPPRDNKIRFFHCAGSGGVGNRKNTNAIIAAYNEMKSPETELIITHLNSKVFTKEQIIAFTKYADVLLNPAKWDTIGLNTIEANICGIPSIVIDAPPMNELVQDNVNGLLVEGKETKFEGVTCPAYEVDVKELAKKMTIMKNKTILDVLKRNSRKYAEENFDWSKNKEHFLKWLK